MFINDDHGDDLDNDDRDDGLDNDDQDDGQMMKNLLCKACL